MSAGQFGPYDGLHVCMLSRRKAEAHTRHVYNVRPEVLLGWTPYRVLVTSHGATAYTAFVRVREFRAWLSRVPGARLCLARTWKAVGMRVGRVEVRS